MNTVSIDLFNFDFSLINSFEELREILEFNKFKYDEIYFRQTVAACGFETSPDDGKKMFYMVIPQNTPVEIVIHECSHMVDFIFERLNVPTGVENTEIRAHLMEHMYRKVEECRSQQTKKIKS